MYLPPYSLTWEQTKEIFKADNNPVIKRGATWTQTAVVQIQHTPFFFKTAPYFFISTLKQYKEKTTSDSKLWKLIIKKQKKNINN